MVQLALLAISAAFILPSALADRGRAPSIAPTICNNAPAESEFPPDEAARRAARAVLLETTTLTRTEPVPTTIAVRARQARSLQKRGGEVRFNDDCNGDIPERSGYRNEGAGFTTMRSVLEAAYADAVTLAQGAQNVAAENRGFTHYFGGEGADVQLNHFRRMMTLIADSNRYYTIRFQCTPAAACMRVQSAMATDITVGGPNTEKIIEVCDNFWTSASTAHLLYRSGQTTPRPPFRDNTAETSQWCPITANGVSHYPHQYYAVAGTTVLHELTHLSNLGREVGLEADLQVGNSIFGTTDAQNGCELEGARRFLRDYNVGNTQGTSPDYNAESYAAAATEIYFMNLCQFTEIRPVVR